MSGIRVLSAAEAPPIPEPVRRYGPMLTAVCGLEIGGFAFIPGPRRSSQSAAVSRTQKALSRRFTTRRMEFEGEVGLGIWRLSDPPLQINPKGFASACHSSKKTRARKRIVIEDKASSPAEQAYRDYLNGHPKATVKEMNAAWTQAIAKANRTNRTNSSSPLSAS